MKDANINGMRNVGCKGPQEIALSIEEIKIFTIHINIQDRTIVHYSRKISQTFLLILSINYSTLNIFIMLHVIWGIC